MYIYPYLAQQGQLDVDPGPEPCAQVGGTGEDVTEPLVPHKLPAFLLDQMLHLRDRERISGNTASVCVFIQSGCVGWIYGIFVSFRADKLFSFSVNLSS